MTSSRWGGVSALVLLLCCLAVPVFAQSQEERIQQLEQEVEALRTQVAAMKSDGGQGDDARLTELERRIEVLAGEIERLRIGEAAATADTSTYGLGPAASKIYRTERGLSIGGYGEVRYQDFGNDEPAEFDLLRAVLYFGYKFDDQWLFNAEIEYEHGGEEVGVEFAYLDYLWRPQASFRAGMVLVPMGFINELHEPTVFLGANRPDVERLILPTTWRENGFGLFGEAGSWSYRTYIVAGFDASGFTAGGLRGGRQEGIESKADDLAWVGRLDFTGVPGLLVGGSAYVGDSGQDLDTAVGTQLLEAHLEWRWRGLQLRALGVRGELDDVAELNAVLGLTGDESVGEQLDGGYVELGYDVLAGRSAGRALIPYARWETYNTQAEVPAGFQADPANDVDSLTLGLAFKPIDQIVLKVDHQDYDNAAGTADDQFHVVLGWVF